MRRRSFLAGVAGGVGGLAGCSGTYGLVDPGIPEREFPERPDELTSESVAEYVADYEKVRVHNDHADAGATEVNVETISTFDYEADEGYHATVQHAGTVYHDEDGERSVGELYSAPIPYRVTSESTFRADITHETVLDADTTDESVDPSLGVRVPNFTDGPREMTISTVADAGNGDLVSQVTVDVDSLSAVELHSVATVPGTYRVIARLEENGVTGEGRVIIDLPGVDRESDVDVLLTPEGLSTRPLPPFESL